MAARRVGSSRIPPQGSIPRVASNAAPRAAQRMAAPRTAAPTTAAPTTAAPRTAAPRTAAPRTAVPRTVTSRTVASRTVAPRTAPTAPATQTRRGIPQSAAPQAIRQIPGARREVARAVTANVAPRRGIATSSGYAVPLPIPQITRHIPGVTTAPLPAGHYVLQPKRGATINRAGVPVILSSPRELRQILEKRPPMNVRNFGVVPEKHKTWRDPVQLYKHPHFPDVEAANIVFDLPGEYEDEVLVLPQDFPLNQQLNPDDVIFFDDDGGEYVVTPIEEVAAAVELPSTSRMQPSPQGTAAVSQVPFDFDLGLTKPRSSLEKVVEDDLQRSYLEHPERAVNVKSWRERPVTVLPVIQTPEGPVEGFEQVNVEQTVRRSSKGEIVKKHATHIEPDEMGGAREVELNVENLNPSPKAVAEQGDDYQEMISETSSITLAPGIVKKIVKKTYATSSPERDTESGVDPATVLRLVEEENQAIDMMKDLPPINLKGSFSTQYDLKKKIDKTKLDPKIVQQLESTVERRSKPTEDEKIANLQPELMAAFMHTTEQQGISMGSKPDDVCNLLFPEKKEGEAVIEVSAAAASSDAQEGVAPRTLTPVPPINMEPDLYTAVEMKSRNAPRTPSPSKTKYKRVKAPYTEIPLLDDIEAPWLDDSGTGAAAVPSAPPESELNEVPTQAPSVSFADEVEEKKMEAEVLEYCLTLQPPRHISRVQLRGSQKPPWFPGYMLALPDNLRVAKSLSEVLPAAWRAVQPDIFTEESFVVLS